MARTFERALREDAAGSSSAEEEELVPGEEMVVRSRRRAFVAGVGVLCLAGALAGVVVFASKAHRSLRAEQPMTARGLLESRELSDLVTDNLMAVGGEAFSKAERGEAFSKAVHGAVAAKLMNISSEIHQHFPEDHQKMETLTLSPAQKESVLGALKHFGDRRLMDLATQVSSIVKETAQNSGDEAELKRRLTEKLAPRAGELQKLGQELFPGQGGGFSLNFEDTPVTNSFRQWHVQMSMSSPEVGMAQTARRLTAQDLDDLAGGVSIQAESMFDHLSSLLGPKMPSAPARMLYSQRTQQSGKESLMACMMRQFSSMDVMGCVSCLMENMKAVMKMVSGFMMGKGP